MISDLCSINLEVESVEIGNILRGPKTVIWVFNDHYADKVQTVG